MDWIHTTHLCNLHQIDDIDAEIDVSIVMHIVEYSSPPSGRVLVGAMFWNAAHKLGRGDVTAEFLRKYYVNF